LDSLGYPLSRPLDSRQQMIGFLQRGVLFDDGVGGLVGEDGEHMDVALLASLLRVWLRFCGGRFRHSGPTPPWAGVQREMLKQIKNFPIHYIS
jgi:hypothetical protein